MVLLPAWLLAATLVFYFGAGGSAAAPETPDAAVQAALNRLSEEAEIFIKNAPSLVARETLRQRAVKTWLPSSRSRPRPPVYQQRVVVSEYGYASLAESPGVLHELRKVVSVDGRRILRAREARTALTMGVTTPDDRLKQKLLRELESYGLSGAVTDFGPMISLFSRAALPNYSFRLVRREFIGAEQAIVLSYRQKDGGGLTIFENREALKLILQGEIWLREPDFVPLKITTLNERKHGGEKLRDEGAVEYTRTSHGVLVPASVVHRQFRGSTLVAENLFLYSEFGRLSAEPPFEK